MDDKYLYAEFKEDEKTEGCSPVLYDKHSIEHGYKLFEVLDPDCTTLLESWKKAVTQFSDNNCLGHIEGDAYVWRTYKQSHDEAQALAKSMWSKNLIPSVETDGKTFRMLGLYSRNRPEWALCNWAIMHFSGTVVTLYNTLGDDSLKYAFEHTEISAIACDDRSFKKVLDLKVNGFATSLKDLIAFDPFTEEDAKAYEDNGVTVHSYSELVEHGKTIDDSLLDEMPKPDADTTDVIWYTSGTTGVPKGAMISHRNYTSNFKGAIDNDFDFNESDTIISYLPLAHCYEKWLMGISLTKGVAIGYFRGDPLKLVLDIQMLKPTILPCVPRVMTKLYDAINMMMSKEDWKNKLYHAALKNKTLFMKRNGKVSNLFWDSVLFKNTKQVVGGRVRFMITGSAPISADIVYAIKCCFSSVWVEGYGQTETNAPISSTNPSDYLHGHVGGPLSSVWFKTEDIPEMEYLSTDKPYPRGELWVKGPTVFQGYYKNEEKNKEAFDDQGWLHTGDVVEIWENGAIRLIDRKKNLFKLSQGEYISPEKLENVYNKSQFVAQIFVAGESIRSYLVAVIVPDEDYCKLWASKKGLELSGDELYHSKEFKDALDHDLMVRHDKAELNSLEKIKKYHITRVPFSVDNNLLTPSQKLMRYSAKKHFKEIIHAMYEEDEQ